MKLHADERGNTVQTVIIVVLSIALITALGVLYVSRSQNNAVASETPQTQEELQELAAVVSFRGTVQAIEGNTLQIRLEQPIGTVTALSLEANADTVVQSVDTRFPPAPGSQEEPQYTPLLLSDIVRGNTVVVQIAEGALLENAIPTIEQLTRLQ